MIAAERNPEAQALAHRFEAVVQTLIALLERCSAEQWRTICPEEGWTVGVTAHHVAGSFRYITGLIGTLVAGNPLPEMTAAEIDEGNARHAVKFADCDQSETIAGLRAKGAAAAQLISGLSEEQLSKAAPFTLRSGRVTSARTIIERMLIGHVEIHRADIEAAIGQA